MDNSFHYLLMANQVMVHKKLLNGLKGSGLTLGQPKILDYLKNHEGSSQKDIALGCHIEAASLTSLLARMEEKGMIERRSKNGNRRSLYIYLTALGKTLQQCVEQEFLKIESEIFQAISPQEQQILLDSMKKIYHRLLLGKI